MSLQLTKKLTRVFSGTEGRDVLLGISGAGGAKADILATHYNGITQTAPPFQIKLAKGDLGLVVVLASLPDTAVSVEEVDVGDDKNRQTLAQTFFSAHDPSVVITVSVP